MNIKDLKGVGPKLSEYLKSLGIYTIVDAVNYFPRSYEDRENIKAINECQVGEFAAFQVEVKQVIPAQRTYTRKSVNKVVFKNDSGSITGIWFNQPYIKNNFTVGEKLSIWGKISKSKGEVQIIDPQYEKNVDNTTLGINPIYPTNKNISQKILRKIIKQALEHIDEEVIDILPESLKKIYGIPDIKMTLINIHFPQNNESLNMSRNRIKFQELLLLQLCLFISKTDYLNAKLAQGVDISSGMLEIKESLPFELTGAQTRTVREMLKDMKRTIPMNRLVQGDVGSGKTIVAIIGLINSAMGGFQGAMLAPTEILAAQHYVSIASFAQKFNLKIAILTGSTPGKEKKEILQGIKSGEIKIVIGTHAIIQDNVEFSNLVLVVTDEQHRFGVRQRAKLINKGYCPHVLVMTATPIPRTLALFIYGDMDISIIDELPPGRKKIDTYYLQPAKKARIYNFIKKEIVNGRQAYVVCPLVEESEKLKAESVLETAENIKALYFEDSSVAFLHGKMPPKEKEGIMRSFKNGDIDVLVSTTVIEVGVNVPNASVMVIENAERFGLAQLHQLRGRVGRGEYKSYCVLISGVQSKECLDRMKIMAETNDGFKIADKDMELRGTGEFFGFRQHGMPELKMADIIKDIELVKKTRDLARELIDTGDISTEPYKAIKAIVYKFFQEKADEITFN